MALIPAPEPRTAPPQTFGYLRRPELDDRYGGQVWERPNGRMVVFKFDCTDPAVAIPEDDR